MKINASNFDMYARGVLQMPLESSKCLLAEDFVAYLDGKLSLEEELALEAHMNTCKICMEKLVLFSDFECLQREEEKARYNMRKIWQNVWEYGRRLWAGHEMISLRFSIVSLAVVLLIVWFIRQPSDFDSNQNNPKAAQFAFQTVIEPVLSDIEMPMLGFGPSAPPMVDPTELKTDFLLALPLDVSAILHEIRIQRENGEIIWQGRPPVSLDQNKVYLRVPKTAISPGKMSILYLNDHRQIFATYTFDVR